MSGIVFLKTLDMQGVRDFYVEGVGMETWLEQADCIVLRHGNMLLGFCEKGEADLGGIITFFYDTRADVDAKYGQFRDAALGEPSVNGKYRIYNFFANDPEGRTVEFQAFLHPVKPHLAADELLRERRSIRRFTDEPVPDDILVKVLDNCRYAPTSKNSPSVYYVVVRDTEKQALLAELRGANSAPIGRSPVAVAVCVDADKTLRPVQDGDIAAYHLTLAAKAYGLGTCWIAAMDRDEAKEALDVPREHYIATVTPLGWPAERPAIPSKRDVADVARFVDP